MRLFPKPADFDAFERILEKTLESRPMQICAYCLMSGLWRRVDGRPEDRRWLSDWPVPRPGGWPTPVNEPQAEPESGATGRRGR